MATPGVATPHQAALRAGGTSAVRYSREGPEYTGPAAHSAMLVALLVALQRTGAGVRDRSHRDMR